MKKFCMAVGMWALALVGSQAVSAAGAAVYVDVETEAGTFTIEMDAGARNGGAAFLGLAEGWMDWVDPRNGQLKHGVGYHAGTAMSWVKKDEKGEAVLVGNLGYAFTGADGGRNWNNGGGIQMQDDVSGATGLTARSVAMVQQEGPHSINGRWAVLLKDADEQYGGIWSRIGTVASNWGVVEALAGRTVGADGWMEKPVEVTGMRVHGDAGEIAAWRAVAEANAPVCDLGETGLAFYGETATLTCRMEGRGTYAIAHTTNLTDRVWNVNWMDWYEGGGGLETNLVFSTALGAFGPRRSFAVDAVEYPELGGPTVTGRYSFRVEWELGTEGENEVYQYDLDVGAGTGMVWQLDRETQSKVLRSAPCNQIIIARSGAHSMGVSVVISDWGLVPYYWLGEEHAGDGAGRFRMWEWMSGGNLWGSWIGRAVPADGQKGGRGMPNAQCRMHNEAERTVQTNRIRPGKQANSGFSSIALSDGSAAVPPAGRGISNARRQEERDANKVYGGMRE